MQLRSIVVSLIHFLDTLEKERKQETSDWKGKEFQSGFDEEAEGKTEKCFGFAIPGTFTSPVAAAAV
ncbi:hypothetical protein P7K49_027287 [Saguinus oedipus]|uniref:Uncharacterized protein n=1 Tax=Saguinus oedipus TaxID=9490 RepID=A0ABQ9U9T9_SAGOE|nr:hypothetical protein P7K49_027287 [Saguinus oedipus]